jgi:uncharacterized protein YndB with AHSA1/START domain
MRSNQLSYLAIPRFAGANIISLQLIHNKIFFCFNIFSILQNSIESVETEMRVRYDLEYTLNCSPKVLFSRLSTPEGLSEWFADDVNVDGDIFSFFWSKSELKARLIALKENKFVRFEWLDNNNEASNYFEFKINIEELTGSLALIITDFADPEEKEDAIYLWDSQITELKRVLGI